MTPETTITMLRAISAKMTAERDYLCELDGQIGDADHGIAMQQGFAAVSAALILTADTTITDIFNTTAKAFLNAVGASSGPLYATAFLRAGKWAAGRKTIPAAEIPALFAAMAQGIADRGKAEPGEKTMFDVWHPAALAAASGDLKAIVKAADAGAEATKAMLATKGRAARLGGRSIGHIDPGAASAAMIIAVMADYLGRRSDGPALPAT